MSSTATTSPDSMVDQIVEIFYQYSKQFIEALCEVWPECPELKRHKLKFELACVHPPASLALPSKRKLVANYHATMSPFYNRCTQKDESLLMDQNAQQDIDILNDIKFYQKWSPDLHPETKENVWEYILSMNRYSNLYNLYSNVPSGMMGTIESMATGIASKMESGEMTMQDLNLQDLGQSVMQNIDKGELESFAGNMAGNMGDINSMYGMLGSMLSSMPSMGAACPPCSVPAAAAEPKVPPVGSKSASEGDEVHD